MSFIEKKEPVVLNIKLTSKGREVLSTGNLNFKYFAIGDSEIDYSFNSAVNTIDSNANLPYFSSILRAADKNPSLLSYITKNNDNVYLNTIPSVPSTTSIIQNTARPLGFFNVLSGNTTFITDPDYVKQPDAMVKLETVNGGTLLELYKAPTYLSNLNIPTAGDLVLIKWTNPFGRINTTGYTVNKLYTTPYLIYKIVSVTGGSNTLIATVRVDRELPNFNGNGIGVLAGALIYYNYINYTGDTIYNYYSTDYLNESVIAFLENCQCPTIRFPFWNMSVIFTEEIAGVKLTEKQYTQFNSRIYGGFVSYIQNQAPIIKKMGVIHYTNSAPSNTYAEELYQNTPTLTIPTIMWHKSTSNQLGVVLKAYGGVKTLTGVTRSLNTTYYDLADLNGNIVGKVFNNLKLFTIEDQELLFAMSYKSNRSWTLPNYTLATNSTPVFGCPDCAVTFDVTITQPTMIGANDGKLLIDNILNTIGTPPDVELVLSVSGITHGRVYFEPITGTTLVSGLYSDTYHIILYDLRATTSTCSGQTIVFVEPSSKLKLYDIATTDNGLNPDFVITQQNVNGVITPTNIIIPFQNIGNAYGTPTIGMNTYPAPAFTFFPFNGGDFYYNNLSFKEIYTITIKDEIIIPMITAFTETRNYVAVGSPINENFTISALNSDINGNYFNLIGYKAVIINDFNPIIGTIEYSVYPKGSFPSVWTELTTDEYTNGTDIKIYTNETGLIEIGIRETYQGVIAAESYKEFNLNI